MANKTVAISWNCTFTCAACGFSAAHTRKTIADMGPGDTLPTRLAVPSATDVGVLLCDKCGAACQLKSAKYEGFGSPTVTRDEPNARTNQRHSTALVASVQKDGMLNPLLQGTPSAESSTDEDPDLKAAGIRKASALKKEAAAAAKRMLQKQSAPAPPRHSGSKRSKHASSASAMETPAAPAETASAAEVEPASSHYAVATASDLEQSTIDSEEEQNDAGAPAALSGSATGGNDPSGVVEYVCVCEVCETEYDPHTARFLDGCPHCEH